MNPLVISFIELIKHLDVTYGCLPSTDPVFKELFANFINEVIKQTEKNMAGQSSSKIVDEFLNSLNQNERN